MTDLDLFDRERKHFIISQTVYGYYRQVIKCSTVIPSTQGPLQEISKKTIQGKIEYIFRRYPNRLWDINSLKRKLLQLGFKLKSKTPKHTIINALHIFQARGIIELILWGQGKRANLYKYAGPTTGKTYEITVLHEWHETFWWIIIIMVAFPDDTSWTANRLRRLCLREGIIVIDSELFILAFDQMLKPLKRK